MILGYHIENGKFPSNLMAVSKHSQERANVVEMGHIREALFPLLSQGSLAWAEDPFRSSVHLILKSGAKGRLWGTLKPTKEFQYCSWMHRFID